MRKSQREIPECDSEGFLHHKIMLQEKLDMFIKGSEVFAFMAGVFAAVVRLVGCVCVCVHGLPDSIAQRYMALLVRKHLDTAKTFVKVFAKLNFGQTSRQKLVCATFALRQKS